jgi:hypothetical protein
MTLSDFIADGAHDVRGNGNAARDHSQNDHRRRQRLVLPLCYPMDIPGKKNCVLLDSNSSKRKHRIEPSREVGMRISENLL